MKPHDTQINFFKSTGIQDYKQTGYCSTNKKKQRCCTDIPTHTSENYWIQFGKSLESQINPQSSDRKGRNLQPLFDSINSPKKEEGCQSQLNSSMPERTKGYENEGIGSDQCAMS